MKISIRQKLVIYASVILLINGFIGYAVYKSNQKLRKSEQWVQHTEQVIYQSEKIFSLSKDFGTASRGFVITNDSAFLEPLFTAKKIIFENIGQLRQLTLNNSAQQQRVDSINFYMHKRLDFSLQQVALRSKQGLASAIAFTSTNKGMNYSNRMLQFITAIQQEEGTFLNQRKLANERSIKVFNSLSMVLFVLMGILTVFLLIIIGKNLVQNEEKEKQTAELIIANEERRETNEYLENLLNSANAPIIVWNTKFEITRFNRAFEIITGRTEKEVLGKSLEILFPPTEKENSMKLIWQTETGTRLEDVEINIIHLDDSVRTLLWNSANIMSSDGNMNISV